MAEPRAGRDAAMGLRMGFEFWCFKGFHVAMLYKIQRAFRKGETL